MLKFYVTYRKPGADCMPLQEKVCESQEELEAFILAADQKAPDLVRFEQAVGRPRSGYQPQWEIVRIIKGEEVAYIENKVWEEVLVPKQITKKEWKL